MSRERVAELTELYLNGALSAAQREELESLLLASQQARLQFWETAAVHAQLHVALDQAAATPAEAATIRRDAFRQQWSAALIAGLRSVARDFARQPVALAILLLVMLFGGVLFWQLSQLSPQPVAQQQPPPTETPDPGERGADRPEHGAPTVPSPGVTDVPPAVPADRPVIARLARSVDASWDQSEALTDGASLKAQQKLSLKQGLAEIVFDSGTTVVLEGPAELVLGSEKAEGRSAGSGVGGQGSGKRRDNACSLMLGRLVARVPQQARGFTVATPTMTIIDHGTQFGVSVRPAEKLTPDTRHPTPPLTEVQVFQGLVEVQPQLAQAPQSEIKNQESQILRAGEGVISEPGGAAPRTIKAEPTRFVRELPAESIAATKAKREREAAETAANSPLAPGDILAVSRHALTLVKINPRTGAQTVLAQGDRNVHGKEWMCVVVDAQRRVYVGAGACPGPGPGSSVLGVDPRTGAIRVIARGGPLSEGRINGITTAADGALYVSVDGDHDQIVKIDPAKGAASVVCQFGENAWGIAMDSNRSDLIAVSDGSEMVARISGTTVTPWIYGPEMKGARGVAVRPDGRVFVSAYSDPGRRRVMEIDRQSHRVTQIAALPPQQGATIGMLAVEPDGNLILGSYGDEGRVYRIDVEKGTAAVLASDGKLAASGGVAVVPSVVLIPDP